VYACGRETQDYKAHGWRTMSLCEWRGGGCARGKGGSWPHTVVDEEHAQRIRRRYMMRHDLWSARCNILPARCQGQDARQRVAKTEREVGAVSARRGHAGCACGDITSVRAQHARAQQTCWAHVAGDLGTRPLSFLPLGAQECNVLTVHNYFNHHRSLMSFVPAQP
jgi:hypothetical protein